MTTLASVGISKQDLQNRPQKRRKLAATAEGNKALLALYAHVRAKRAGRRQCNGTWCY